MTLQMEFFNIWAVLVCVICNMVIGSLWYSPVLFGNIWLKMVGKTKEEISQKEGSKAMTLSIIPAALSILLLAVTLALLNTSTLADALIIGSLVSAGFIGMNALNLVLFEGRSMGLWLVNVGYSFVAMNIAAVILTLWK